MADENEPQPVTSLSGPVERIGEQLVLRIPLHMGGEALRNAARGISSVVGTYLEVRIPDWLAEKLGIREGSVVDIDDSGGRFNITPHADQVE